MNLQLSSSILRTAGIFVYVLIVVSIIAIIIFSSLEKTTKYLSILGTLASIFFLTIIYLISLLRDKPRPMSDDPTEDQALFAELYQNSPIPYIRASQNGVILHANSAAVRLFGETEQTLLNKNIFSAIHGEGKSAAHVARIPQLVAAGSFVNNQEVQLMRTDGDMRWIMLSAFPYAHKTESLVTLVDVTKQKNIDTAKTEFVSLASHQLRTPISSIKWNSELLSSPRIGELNAAQKDLVDKINRGSDRMALLIKDFLDASQLEMGTFATEVSDVDLTAFIEDQFEEFDADIAKKQLIVEKLYPQSAVTFKVDAHLLRMTVNNLISNAVKYTPEGGTLTLGYVAGAGTVSITIRDTGMGIPEGEKDKLFSKFFRATNVTETIIGGTGIGLYIVKQAVDMMNGTIVFSSKEGEGTEFVVTLPTQAQL